MAAVFVVCTAPPPGSSKTMRLGAGRQHHEHRSSQNDFWPRMRNVFGQCSFGIGQSLLILFGVRISRPWCVGLLPGLLHVVAGLRYILRLRFIFFVARVSDFLLRF